MTHDLIRVTCHLVPVLFYSDFGRIVSHHVLVTNIINCYIRITENRCVIK